jgi:hypothetical protein
MDGGRPNGPRFITPFGGYLRLAWEGEWSTVAGPEEARSANHGSAGFLTNSAGC